MAASRIPLPSIPLHYCDVATDPVTAPHYHLSIHEAIGIALNNSEVVRNLGLVDARSDTDIVRAEITSYDPPAAWAAADAEWGIFDPRWIAAVQWDRFDVPPGLSFNGIGNRPPELDTADFATSIEQLMPLGTRFRADYVTNYLFNPARPLGLNPNPQYYSYTQFGVTQPLCRDLGCDVTLAPIRIVAAQAEQTDWKFKQEMLALVRSVETSYWSLYAEQQNLRAVEEVLPLFGEVVRIRSEQASREAGTESQVARARSEMLRFAQRRLEVLSRIGEFQLVLRNLMGLSPNDGRYLTLMALPVRTGPFENVCDAVATAVNRRPDVLRQRLAVYVAEQERVLARNALRPVLNFGAFWRINGLGNDLGSSLDVIGQNDFHDWQLGFSFEVPIGRREARADLRSVEYLIQKERALLNQTAHQASHEVADAFRRITWLNQQREVAADRVAALQQWRVGAIAQFENPPPGMSTLFALELYLQNLRDQVDASTDSNALLANYNSAIARFEEVKGTLLDARRIEIDGDATDLVPDGLPSPDLRIPE